MDISKQVITLSQSIRLKELGIIQKSAFYYYQQFVNSTEAIEIYPLHYQSYGSLIEDENIRRAIDRDANNEVYSAFTVAELGVMLPENYMSAFNYAHRMWMCFKIDDGQLEEIEDLLYDNVYGFPTEAQARAATVIYLFKNNLATPTEVNERLRVD